MWSRGGITSLPCVTVLFFHVPIFFIFFCNDAPMVGTQENSTDLQPSQDCLCFVLNSFKLRQSHVFHVDLPLWANRRGRQTTKGILWFQERQRVEQLFIKSNPIWKTSLKIIYLPFSGIHVPWGKSCLCIRVCKLWFSPWLQTMRSYLFSTRGQAGTYFWPETY